MKANGTEAGLRETRIEAADAVILRRPVLESATRTNSLENTSRRHFCQNTISALSSRHAAKRVRVMREATRLQTVEGAVTSAIERPGGELLDRLGVAFVQEAQHLVDEEVVLARWLDVSASIVVPSGDASDLV